jgi:hypothetical protein
MVPPLAKKIVEFMREERPLLSEALRVRSWADGWLHGEEWAQLIFSRAQLAVLEDIQKQELVSRQSRSEG